MATDTTPRGAAAAGPQPNARRSLATFAVLLIVSAAMVYGTWLAVDDMRAKPMVAQVTVANGALVVVNDGDFAWSDARFVVNGTFRADVPAALAPGARQGLPLADFVDREGRTPDAVGVAVREVTATATRHSRFGTLNADRPTTGRWLLP